MTEKTLFRFSNSEIELFIDAKNGTEAKKKLIQITKPKYRKTLELKDKALIGLDFW